MPSVRPALSVDDVYEVAAERCFAPCAKPLVGVELEWLTFDTTKLLARVDPGRLRRCTSDGAIFPNQSILTFEPGGQLELSSPPYSTIDRACAAAAADLAVASRAAREIGVELVGMGTDPLRPATRVIESPRYDAMEHYFAPGGPAGQRMMCSTAAVHINIGLGPTSEDAARQWCIAHDVGPTLAAVFANSPLLNGRSSGFQSSRLAAWWAMDGTRTSPVANEQPGPLAWARYVLDAKIMLIRLSSDSFVPVEGSITFREWLETGHELGYPTTDDLDYHMSTLFPPVRPRGWLELRMVDALPDPLWKVALAVTAALLLDPAAGEDALQACSPAANLWVEAAHLGMRHPELAVSAIPCFDAAQAALDRLGVGRTIAAQVQLFRERYVDRGRSPADDRLDEWARDGSLLPGFSPAAMEQVWI
ncbi:MAG TPA: ergothioneine biosynthesis glutamate--cysteine ligase EgtA [Acidimicrobiales bacterium]|nr:ergothioneine biosynthesis glutamate--cysteine ligase EgtA [Acidimicrobiales bacterium]